MSLLDSLFFVRYWLNSALVSSTPRDLEIVGTGVTAEASPDGRRFIYDLSALAPSGAAVYDFDRDIRRFGAVAGEDSTAAILAAIADLPATGGRVIVPTGVYDVDNELVLGDRVALVGGPGSCLRKTGTDHHVVRISGDYSGVYGLEIDGNEQPEGALITVHGSDNIVWGNYLHDNGDMGDADYTNASHGITLDGQSSTCERNIIGANRVVACHSIGISQHTTSFNRILNNTVRDCGLEGITIDVTSHHSKVLDNLIAGSCVRGGVGGIGIDGSELYVISGNTISGTLNSLSGIKTQNNTGNASFGSIVNNIILDNGGWGVWIFAGTSGSPDSCVISNNIVRGNTSGSIRLDSGCDNHQVRGNSLNGVAVSNAGTNNTIN